MHHAKIELNEPDQKFLLEGVEQSNSDYDDELEGRLNFDVSDGVLSVTFETDAPRDGDRLIYRGRWALTFVDGSVTAKAFDH